MLRPLLRQHRLVLVFQRRDASSGRHKVMAANRGEIALRIFRAAAEMGYGTVAIYSKQDIVNIHRLKADEAFLVGEGKSPVGAYLDMDSIIEIAKRNGVTMIHPGYGFLSENADFAKKVEDAGIRFIGPTPDTVRLMGDKVHARKVAMECGVPVVPGTENPVTSVDEAIRFSKGLYPVILKAAHGGGGRGMRVVHDESQIAEAFQLATSEARAAFGREEVFIEKYVQCPRHIEVQILGDSSGNVVHLFERDCSVQRRHQKVIELAPAPQLPADVRDGITECAVKLARRVKYRNAGTVEFLVDKDNKFYFIEVNARLQVEHTVTEEITGIDIVQSQLSIADGKSLPDLGLVQDKISYRGAAIQARVTTEDPSNGFKPDAGRIEVFRTGEGMGIRLDGQAYAGGVISPHYDSLLVKVTSKGANHQQASRKLARALEEFRVRGVSTNIPFIINTLRNQQFLSGVVDTSFIDSNPSLTKPGLSRNRAQKLLYYIADIHVNGPRTPLLIPPPPGTRPYSVDPTPPPLRPDHQSYVKNNGWRHVLTKEGPEGFLKKVRAHKGTLLMDTTMRDAHQSLLVTRVRTRDLEAIAPYTAESLAPSMFSLECWGGATFDVALRFLRECPWERLRILREKIPNIPFQMLLRGANGVGYTNYPDNAIYKFCEHAHKTGVDIFRVFDSLNYYPNMELGIKAAVASGGVAEAAICYTGDITDPKRTKYSLDYYINFAEKLMEAGAHCLAIKDMAGLLKPRASRLLVSKLRERFPDTVIHVHTHDTAGAGVASMLEAAAAGADVVDAAIDSMSGMTSQPSLGAILAALEGTDLAAEYDMNRIMAINSYWESVRRLYGAFECTATMRSGSSDVYRHEIPGGQYTNMHFQAFSMGMGDQWNEIKEMYHTANMVLGDIIKVTPSSKVVGDLAQFMVRNKLDEKSVVEKADTLNFPSSVVEYLQGLIGEPTGGFPEPLRERVLKQKGLKRVDGRAGAVMPPVDFDKVRKEMQANLPDMARGVSDDDLMSYIMYPEVFKDYAAFKNEFGDVSRLPTSVYFHGIAKGEAMKFDIEKGKTIHISLKTSSDLPNDRSHREVYFEMNGQQRTVYIPVEGEGKQAQTRQKADKANPGHVGAPMPGEVVEVAVTDGVQVKKGTKLAVMSAMKMETIVSAPTDGVVRKMHVAKGDQVVDGDLIVELEVAPQVTATNA
eukprot:Sspe_Gene.27676::Locus_12040_Transcript_1_1_Confidence_1.000_Length_3661::g.27676::m.27676/K01958/PC, pyc; pyruvate carboxylase